MDRLTKEQRRKCMQAVKSKDTDIEIILEKSLRNIGLSFKKNDKTVPGTPDFTFKKRKVAVFCDSEFWHGKDWKNKKGNLKTNRDFWLKKIERNIRRDIEVTDELEKKGWIVLRFWGKTILKNPDKCALKIKRNIKKKTVMFKNILTVNEILEKQPLNGESAKAAAFTHYLHNTDTGIKKYYKRDALDYAKKILEYEFPKEVISFKAAEEELKYDFFDYTDVPFLPSDNPKFKFIDLFSGIGGFRIAMQSLGGKCVFSSESDDMLRKIYRVNFGEIPFGDIAKKEIKSSVPAGFDILCACFRETRKTSLLNVVEIIENRRPRAVFLENDGGKNISKYLNLLQDDLGYFIPEPLSINRREKERIFVVGFHKKTGVKEFKYPKPSKKKKCLKNTDADGEAGIKMTVREKARLQGFPEKFIVPVSGVSVRGWFDGGASVPEIQAAAKEILKSLGIL